MVKPIEILKMSFEENTTVPKKLQIQMEESADITSKHFYRQKVWDYLEKNRLVNFPRPAFGRIPNFKGADAAAAKLLQLKEFKAAKAVEVNPDKPLEFSRILVVENDKILYVPVRKLQEGFLKKISFCNEDKPENVKQTVTRWGIDTLGKTVNIKDNFHIDLIVLGSVAVSLDGYRIGKGRGYADLEYAILKEIKAVDDETVIVTTVHDSQVFDSFPGSIFKMYDVPVDYILTPTNIIKVDKKLPRPAGIYWNLLSQRRVNLMSILQKIKDMYSSEGKDTTLKENDTDTEVEERSKPRLNRLPKGRSNSRTSEEYELSLSADDRKPQRRRFFRKTRPSEIITENDDPVSKDLAPMKKRTKWFKRNGRQVDFSLVVSNIDKNVRVRHLKDALIDHGIKPNNITWRGYRGFCYLHYAKSGKKEDNKISEENPVVVDNVIEILQTLKLNSDSSTNWDVKVMEPTRIETTDVTAV